MSRIQNADYLIRWLEGGQVTEDMTTEVRETLAYLYELTAHHPKAKAKGEVKLTLKFTVESGFVHIEAGVTSKRPAKPRGTTIGFLLEDGTISTEHPKQINMFPSERRSTAAE